MDKHPFHYQMAFFEICDAIAKLSKDQNTKVGALIVGPSREIRSTGFNSFPRKVHELPSRQERPGKYHYFEHAERNAIYNAARVGTPLEGCIIYVQWMPCADCARAIIQCGIKEVVIRDKTPDHWGDRCAPSVEMFTEAGVTFGYVGHEDILIITEAGEKV